MLADQADVLIRDVRCAIRNNPVQQETAHHSRGSDRSNNDRVVGHAKDKMSPGAPQNDGSNETAQDPEKTREQRGTPNDSDNESCARFRKSPFVCQLAGGRVRSPDESI